MRCFLEYLQIDKICQNHSDIIHIQFPKAYVRWGGSSMMAKKVGQILVDEDLKRATPSVLIVNDKLAGLSSLHRKLPGSQYLEYSEPS